MVAKPGIEARALGETQVLIDPRPINEAEWRNNRAKEIFFYLLCCGTGQTKEQITAVLWPDLSPAKATSNFHINLYRARRAIFPGVFTLEHGQYRINPHLNIWFDVAEFKHLFSQAERLPYGSKTWVANLEQAVKLYRGSFMKEFYSEWTEMQRRELEDKYLKALLLLASFNSDRGKYDTAITLLEKIIAIDPYNDEAYYQVMERHLSVGDKFSALRIYERYLNTVADELEVAPSTRIRNLHRHILASK